MKIVSPNFLAAAGCISLLAVPSVAQCGGDTSTYIEGDPEGNCAGFCFRALDFSEPICNTPPANPFATCLVPLAVGDICDEGGLCPELSIGSQCEDGAGTRYEVLAACPVCPTDVPSLQPSFSSRPSIDFSDQSTVEVTFEATTTVTTGTTSTTVAPISKRHTRKLQVSSEIEDLFQKTIEDVIRPSLPVTSRLLSVTITSVAEVEGEYTIDYVVVLEELCSDPNCDPDAGSATYNAVTSTLTEKAQDGGFAATLAANAAVCGAECDGFESTSVQAGPFGEPTVVVANEDEATGSKSAKGAAKASKSKSDGSAKASKSEWEAVGQWSKSAKSGDGLAKASKSEWEGIGDWSKSSKSKSAKSVAEMVEAPPTGAEWVCGWSINGMVLPSMEEVTSMIPEGMQDMDPEELTDALVLLLELLKKP